MLNRYSGLSQRVNPCRDVFSGEGCASKDKESKFNSPVEQLFTSIHRLIFTGMILRLHLSHKNDLQDYFQWTQAPNFRSIGSIASRKLLQPPPRRDEPWVIHVA